MSLVEAGTPSMAGSEADGPTSVDTRHVHPELRDRTVKDIIAGMRKRRGAKQMPSTVLRNEERRKRRRREAQGLPPEENTEEVGSTHELSQEQTQEAGNGEAENGGENASGEEEEEEEDVVAPQVTIDEDGNIVIDQASLVVSAGTTTNAEADRVAVTVENHAFSNHITSATYSKRESALRWSGIETDQFYEALRKFGTDFSLMESSFPKRSRRQLKLKFKREERECPDRIDRALNGPPLPLPLPKKSIAAPENGDGPQDAAPADEVGEHGAEVIDSDGEAAKKVDGAENSSDSEDSD